MTAMQPSGPTDHLDTVEYWSGLYSDCLEVSKEMIAKERATIEHNKVLLRDLLPRLGTTSMTHNGHLSGCPLSWPDWIDTDPCTCGRDDLIARVVAAIQPIPQSRQP